MAGQPIPFLPRRGPSERQMAYLRRGLGQPGGKLPLFDGTGRKVNRQTVESCIAAGWAERWFENPTKPDWLVCRLTVTGRAVAQAAENRADAERVESERTDAEREPAETV